MHPAAGPSWSWMALTLSHMREASDVSSQKPRLQQPLPKTLPHKGNTNEIQ